MGLFGSKKKEKRKEMKWIKLQLADELTHLIEKESFVTPILFFKHSTRCSISSMALNRLESYWDIESTQAIPVYLDLIQYRNLSDKLASDLGVRHESPQVLLVKDGKCIYTASHSQIDVEDIKENV